MRFKKNKLRRAEKRRVSVSVYHRGTGEYNTTYDRILIRRKLRGIWRCVLQVFHRPKHLWEYIRYSIMLLLLLPKGEKDVFVRCLCVFVCFLGMERHTKPSDFYHGSCLLMQTSLHLTHLDTSLELSCNPAHSHSVYLQVMDVRVTSEVPVPSNFNELCLRQRCDDQDILELSSWQLKQIFSSCARQYAPDGFEAIKVNIFKEDIDVSSHVVCD